MPDAACSVRKYACKIGDGVSTEFEISHGLNTWAPRVDIYDAHGNMVLGSVTVTNQDSVTIKPSTTLVWRSCYWRVGRWRFRRPFKRELHEIPPRPPAPNEFVVVVSG